jgi:hypothetical protein
MTQPIAQTPAPEQLPLMDLQIVAPPEPEPNTLGQTPHEPASRPWEQELLISGALVFSMLQLPAQLDGWIHAMDPRVGMSGYLVVFFVWYYLKAAVYALAGGFSLHLAVRGYWVGVIGLEAVFPHGIRWDKATSGPILRPVYERRTPSLQTMIDRADRFASLIFVGAFTLALMLMWSLVLGGFFVGLSWAVASAFFTPSATTTIMPVLVLVFMGPGMLATLLDRRLGKRLDPGGRAAEWIRRVGGLYAGIQKAALFMPLMMTIATNLRGRRGARAAMWIGVGGLALFLTRDILGDAVHADGFQWLPDDPGALAVPSGGYADRRGDGPEFASVPFIQSDIVRDPYVRLFIPYRPRRHNDLIPRRCPGVRAAVPAAGAFSQARPEGDRAGQAVLRCLAQLQPVTLDGRSISPGFRFATDPQTGVRGIMAYISVDGLAKGGHVLSIASLPPIEATDADKPRAPITIPFWL